MRQKKWWGWVFACIVAINCFTGSVEAVSTGKDELGEIVTRATGHFSMVIEAETLALADEDFPLEVGETITIKASYTPFSASVDFGFIAPDGLFYSVNSRSGSVDKTIRVAQRGYYTLAVRNNSSESISVSGYVNY